jgi:hypothetical protein
MLFDGYVREPFQSGLAGGQQFHPSALALQKRSYQERRLGRWAVIADVEAGHGSLPVLGGAPPMGYAIFNEEVFVNGSFQIIVPGYVGAGWQSIRPNDIVGRHLGPTATIIELVCGVDAAIRTVGIHFASCYSAVTEDGVVKRLRGSGAAPQMRNAQQQSGE